MIDAGLPLVQCLELLAKEEPDKRLARRRSTTSARTSKPARSLADAMQKRAYAFDALYTHMVAAGEAGGILDVILKRLATFIEKQAKLKSQVRSAMIYPISVLSIAAIVVVIILWKVIPTFTALFEGLAPSCRCRRASSSGSARRRSSRMPFVVGGLFVGLVPVPPVLPDHQRPRCASTAILLRDAARRQDLPQGRGRAVLPHARDAAQLGRADSRRPRHHRQDVGQRVIEDAIKQRARADRARRDDRRSRCAPPACSRRWWRR